MKKPIDAIKEGFETKNGYFTYKFGDGYELNIEPLINQQYYVALYKNQELLIPKVVFKLGYE